MDWLIRMNLRFVIVALIACLSLGVSAQVYKWTDENGRIHYGDKPNERAELKDLRDTISSYKAVSYDLSAFAHSDKVVIYTKPTCGYCKKAMAYFKKKRIKYKEYDITKSNYAKRQYARLNATGVPVIFVGKQRMNGFSQKGFEEIYN